MQVYCRSVQSVVQIKVVSISLQLNTVKARLDGKFASARERDVSLL